MLQTLTFNGARIINAEASFFRYESGSAGGADEAIKVRADGQDLGTYYPGDSVELPERRGMWELTPANAACAGVVRLGVGRVQSARLVGTVSVIDTAKATTMAGIAFAGGGGSGLPAAGNYATIQLANPAASGKRVIVERIQVDAFGGAVGGLAGITNAVQGVLGSTVRSKLAGGAASVAAFAGKADHATDPRALVPSPAFWGFSLAANGSAVWTPIRPIVLMPGYQLTVAAGTAAASLNLTAEFIEEPSV